VATLSSIKRREFDSFQSGLLKNVGGSLKNPDTGRVKKKIKSNVICPLDAQSIDTIFGQI
jgi:hypothetical protein